MRFPVVLKVHPRYQAPASFYYEMASNGLFQVRSTPLYRAVTQVKTGVPGLLPSWEELELRIPPLPTDLLEEVLAFFRDAWHLHGGEAMVVLFYDGSEEFRVGVPPQTVSGYHDTAGAFHAIHRLQYGAVARPEGFVRLGTLHSHADLPAYSSTLDCMDEQYEDGLHGVFGDLQREMPSRSAAFVANGVRFRLLADDAQTPPPLDFFDCQRTPILAALFEAADLAIDDPLPCPVFFLFPPSFVHLAPPLEPAIADPFGKSIGKRACRRA
ncbi:MAG: hypothetical protein ABFS46_19995 [Myxococcota bacterium]